MRTTAILLLVGTVLASQPGPDYLAVQSFSAAANNANSVRLSATPMARFHASPMTRISSLNSRIGANGIRDGDLQKRSVYKSSTKRIEHA